MCALEMPPKCRYNFNRSVTAVRATTVAGISSFERKTHACHPTALLYQTGFFDLWQTCEESSWKIPCGNEIGHIEDVARTRSYNLLRSLNQGMKRYSKCNRRMIKGKFARISFYRINAKEIQKGNFFNYSKVLNLSNSWLKSWKLSALVLQRRKKFDKLRDNREPRKLLFRLSFRIFYRANERPRCKRKIDIVLASLKF